MAVPGPPAAAHRCAGNAAQERTPIAKVLVVEDDPDIRALVEVRLRRLGHRVMSVGSGEEALDLLAGRGAPDVAVLAVLDVLDVQMPGMDGLQLLEAMRLDPELAAVPAIFLSGRVQEFDVEAGRALGATYLTEPVILSALSGAVDKALEPTAATAVAW